MALPNLQIEACDTSNSFVRLGTNPTSAPSLDYNLPHSTVYNAVSFLELTIDQGMWQGSAPPARDRWTEAKGILDAYALGVTAPANTPTWTARQMAAHQALTIEDVLVLNPDAMQPKGNYLVRAGKLLTQSEFRATQKQSTTQIATSPVSEPLQGEVDASYIPPVQPGLISNANRSLIARKLADTDANGLPYLSVECMRLSGRPDYIHIAKPAAVDPHLSLVFHFKFASFLGRYGAGQVLNTVSLLPGEQTTISIRHYERTEETRRKSESVLDSGLTSLL